MENKKVTRKDLTVVKGKIEVDTLIIDDKKINLTPTPNANIEQFITHKDCECCQSEFKKNYSFQRYCDACEANIRRDKYFKLDVVEWNGEDALNIYNDDKYFFNMEDVYDFCDENRISPSDLNLVLCYQTTFSPIDWEMIEQDSTHEDWEPSAELMAKFKEFNEFLVKQSTNTWMPSNKRINISEYL